MAGKVWVAVEPERLQVDAGGQPATAVIAVQNLGTAVDHLSLEVEGLEPAWYTLSGTVLQLFPQERGQAQVHFQVPHRSDVRSGSYPFTVRVRSRADPAEVGTAQGVLEIRPYQVYRFDVMPKRVLGRQGRFRTIIQNIGTADVEPQLQGKDPEALCRFHFRTDRPRVVPGATATIPFSVSPRRSSLVGEPKTFNLTISATPDGGAKADTVQVQFVHQPMFRSLKPLVWLLLLVVIGTVALTALFWPAWLQPEASQTLASGWTSVQETLCKITGGRVACPSGPTKFVRYEGFQRFYKADPDLIGEAVEDEWRDRQGNSHQLTNKGRLLWIRSTNSHYFFTGKKVYILTADDEIVEMKSPRQ